MSSLSSISKAMSSSGSSQTQPSFGSSTELFSLDCNAAAIFLDHNANSNLKFLRTGRFVVNLIVKWSSPVMIITTCMVDNLQWPISKDAPVIRVGKRRFAFGIPGLMYGLQFPSFCEEEQMHELEKVFMKYAHYQHLDKRNLTGDSWKDDDPTLWSKLHPVIKTTLYNTLSLFGQHPGSSPFAIGVENSSIVRVLRTSATTKMVGNAILSGSLKLNHVEIQDMRSELESGGVSGSSDIILEQAFASISVFTNLIEAVEVFWAITSGRSHLLKAKNTTLKEPVGIKMWRLNQVGIAAFLKQLPIEK